MVRGRLPIITVLFLLIASGASAAAALPSAPAATVGVVESSPFFPGATLDPAVPTPEVLLGFSLGARPVDSRGIERCLVAWAESSPRVRRIEHGRTWEGRPLHHVVITSPANHARLDEIRRGWARVADPRQIAAAEADRLAATLPAVAWLAFSIHGDEVSPADAALALAFQLAAATGPEIDRLLADLVVVIDPLQNPDGRDRFLARAVETAGLMPNHDEQSIEQRGTWPWGRGNHYLFDMNRDWTFATQPETRARLRNLADWQPLFTLDVHEMELANQSFLFYPPRAPFNPFLPPPARRWWEVFGLDEARAFDRQGWRYYNGEWADWWFPGYTDSVATFRGSIGILHEQAGITAGSVRLENGQLLSFAEAVHHQVTAAWANLETLARHRAAIGRDFAATRRRAIDAAGPLADRVLAVVPDANRSRLRRFVDLVTLHGGEIEVLTRAASTLATDGLGRQAEVTLPAGTLLVAGRQPEGHLLRAMLDFDIPIPEDILARERAALTSGGETLLYDITGWSLPLLYGLTAYELASAPADVAPFDPRPLADVGSRPAVPADAVWAAGALPGGAPVGGAARATAAFVAAGGGASAAGVADGRALFGFAIDGADDLSVTAAARLLRAGFEVRLADQALVLEGVSLARGSLVVLRDDNRARVDELAEVMAGIGGDLGVAVHPIATGWGPGDLPDLGGRHLRRLVAPRVALVGYGSAEPAAYGALWYQLDRELGVALSALAVGDLGTLDLRRYNVVVLAPGITLDEPAAKALAAWIPGGGTLVAVEGAAAEVAIAEHGLSAVRELAAVAAELGDYRADLLRSWPQVADPRMLAVANRTRTVAGGEEMPWEGVEETGEGVAWGDAESARRETYAERFAPQGALLAGRLDGGHWLSVGRGEELPLFVGPGPVLMARSPVEVVVRLGVLAPAPGIGAPGTAGPATLADDQGRGDDHEQARWRALGWSAVPSGRELVLRLSGLLWPEAATRLANSAYLTREAVGAGQVILFAGQPGYRGAALGTARLFANAVVYGPGCGTEPVLEP